MTQKEEHLKNLILLKVVKQKKMIKLIAAVIQFYFQCARMMMNNISTSSGLNVIEYGLFVPVIQSLMEVNYLDG